MPHPRTLTAEAAPSELAPEWRQPRPRAPARRVHEQQKVRVAARAPVLKEHARRARFRQIITVGELVEKAGLLGLGTDALLVHCLRSSGVQQIRAPFRAGKPLAGPVLSARRQKRPRNVRLSLSPSQRRENHPAYISGIKKGRLPLLAGVRMLAWH